MKSNDSRPYQKNSGKAMAADLDFPKMRRSYLLYGYGMEIDYLKVL